MKKVAIDVELELAVVPELDDTVCVHAVLLLAHLDRRVPFHSAVEHVHERKVLRDAVKFL